MPHVIIFNNQLSFCSMSAYELVNGQWHIVVYYYFINMYIYSATIDA